MRLTSTGGLIARAFADMARDHGFTSLGRFVRVTQSGRLAAAYLAQRAGLLRLLAARLGSAGEAEDALQDLWIRIQASTDPVDNPDAYLFRMANNLATDRRVAAARRRGGLQLTKLIYLSAASSRQA